jgi:hypothetical protein
MRRQATPQSPIIHRYLVPNDGSWQHWIGYEYRGRAMLLLNAGSFDPSHSIQIK